MKRSLIAFHALLACSAIFCQTAEAKVVYSHPDQSSSLESRIEKLRNGDWANLLRSAELEDQQLASSKWGNGGGHKFKNSWGGGKWGNGKSGGKWSNSRPSWRNGGYYGGWRNGGWGNGGWRNGGYYRPGVGWGNGGGGFINW
jgi:rSAM-associated Gly-rich repeat protein